MKNETIPSAYAEALFELAESKGMLDSVSEEVAFLEKLFSEDSTLRVFFESPGVADREKQALFESVFRGKLEDILVNFLLLVVRRGRQMHFLDMLGAFEDLHDEKHGIVHAKVTTAVPLSPESSEALRLTLEKALAKRVILDGVVDEKTLGGLVVRYEGMVLDASLSRALKEMQSPLRGKKFGSELVHED